MNGIQSHESLDSDHQRWVELGMILSFIWAIWPPVFEMVLTTGVWGVNQYRQIWCLPGRKNWGRPGRGGALEEIFERGRLRSENSPRINASYDCFDMFWQQNQSFYLHFLGFNMCGVEHQNSSNIIKHHPTSGFDCENEGFILSSMLAIVEVHLSS